MNDYLISMFIDDELELADKIEFVETVHASDRFAGETISLLEQEKLLRGDLVDSLPAVRFPAGTSRQRRRELFRGWLPPLAGLVTAMILVAGLFLYRAPAPGPEEQLYRFVLYQPDIGRAEIVGTFTGWSPVPMQKVGNSGYWSLTLRIPPGEHRYSYLIGNGRQIADPTVAAHEQDDFGGMNSIIRIDPI